MNEEKETTIVAFEPGNIVNVKKMRFDQFPSDFKGRIKEKNKIDGLYFVVDADNQEWAVSPIQLTLIK